MPVKKKNAIRYELCYFCPLASFLSLLMASCVAFRPPATGDREQDGCQVSHLPATLCIAHCPHCRRCRSIIVPLATSPPTNPNSLALARPTSSCTASSHVAPLNDVNDGWSRPCRWMRLADPAHEDAGLELTARPGGGGDSLLNASAWAFEADADAAKNCQSADTYPSFISVLSDSIYLSPQSHLLCSSPIASVLLFLPLPTLQIAHLAPREECGR